MVRGNQGSREVLVGLAYDGFYTLLLITLLSSPLIILFNLLIIPETLEINLALIKWRTFWKLFIMLTIDQTSESLIFAFCFGLTQRFQPLNIPAGEISEYQCTTDKIQL